MSIHLSRVIILTAAFSFVIESVSLAGSDEPLNADLILLQAEIRANTTQYEAVMLSQTKLDTPIDQADQEQGNMHERRKMLHETATALSTNIQNLVLKHNKILKASKQE